MNTTKAKILTRAIRIKMTNGNDGRGGRWFSSAKVRKEIEALLRAEGLTRKPFEGLVSVKLTRVLGKNERFWDADSILRGNSKELIDALVAVGWFYDDGPKFISEVTGAQDASRREEGPIVIVEVFA